MNPKTELIWMAIAIAFSTFVLAESFSKVSESRKRGYFTAAIVFVLLVTFTVIENIGSIIYGAK